MGRTGITLLDVEKAAIQLQGRGKTPTVDGIRELLGTGSKSTITQHLKTWKSKSDETQGRLPQELLALITGLWERLNTQADQRIIEIENSSEQQIQELRQELFQSQRDNTDLKTKLYQLEESLSVERRAKAECDKQLQLEKQEHSKLCERHQGHIHQLEDQRAENARLHQLATNIQANLEHYQNSMQQARAEQTLAMEKQQIQFQQELTVLQHKLSLYLKQYQESENLLNQKNIEFQRLKEQHHILQQNIESQEQQLQENSQELILFKERYEQYHQQLQTYKNEAVSKNREFIEFEKKIAILTDQCERLKNSLSEKDDKIELLRQEKLFLTQEKSELKGYLKKLATEN